MKKILVIGGSYFTGRIFTLYTMREKLAELSLVNRGKFKMNTQGVTEYVCDRHDTSKLAGLLPKDCEYDALVDFCAYQPGEIKNLLQTANLKIKQYILISTASVYDIINGESISESGNIATVAEDKPVGEYISGKIKLEQELCKTCNEKNIPYTILRPAFIYGPFNYAPRESWFIKNILNGVSIPYPVDSTSKFSFVYVTDVARAIHYCIGSKNAFNETFNLSAPEKICYKSYFKTLRICSGMDFRITETDTQYIINNNVPLPFPLDNDLLYSGEKFKRAFDFKYTKFEDGMKLTYKAFAPLYNK